MAEYIEREATVKAFCEQCSDYVDGKCTYEGACEVCIIATVPTADVQPIRRGRWIDIHEYCKMNGYIPSGVAVYYWCSECMNEQEKISDFCPCCGARMDGEHNE